MKMLILALAGILVTTGLKAQTYAEIRTQLLLRMSQNAKNEVDRGMTIEAFRSKPVAYLIKAAAYAACASDTRIPKQNPPLEDEAYAALTTYRQLEPNRESLNDEVYQGVLLDLHQVFLVKGYEHYKAKQWAEALPNFRKTLDLHSLMVAHNNKIEKVDTNSLILAGFTAEQLHLESEAIGYYSRLIELQVNSPEFENVYRYVVRYYAVRKDQTAFEKYKTLGKKNFPKSEFFDYDKVDYAVGLSEGFSDQLIALENLLINEPGNYKANLLLGQLIYDTLNSRSEGAVQPYNATDLEPKMIAAFLNVATIQPDSAIRPYIYLGDHFGNIADRLSSATEKLRKTNPVDQTAISNETKKFEDAYDQFAYYYLKVAVLFGKATTLSKAESRQYKLTVGVLAEYFSYKQKNATGEEKNRFALEEKKWNNLYASL